jgi:hypothetical protein
MMAQVSTPGGWCDDCTGQDPGVALEDIQDPRLLR